MDKTFTSYRIEDRSLVAFIKREIHNLALQCGFTAHRAGETDIIIAELASNLIKFAGSGELLYRAVPHQGKWKIELYVLDKGIGIDNIAKIMHDGYSSSNTLGQGLGAIRRLSNTFQIYSMKGWGTVQYVEICESVTSEPPVVTQLLPHAVIATNCPGEKVCGDGYHIKYLPGGLQIFVGDGLGHGPNAFEAVQNAISVFKGSMEKDPTAIIREIHERVKKTRGLVATVASVDYASGIWTICGVGNISTRLYMGMENKTYTPYNGIIGHNIPRTLNNTTVPYSRHQILIMHSDGLRTRWNLNDLKSIIKQDSALVAAALYKDNWRGNDDATIMVAKLNQ
ncbi:SpoIIE family protein phosphatase [Flavobacterium sp. PLA-1-15]|uniref:SpoIIE family protein phosphatase n=1 Tax=Flavobacterium sp. PLA-1-15 TaxID=3380533 RepID=UPI003B7FC2E6